MICIKCGYILFHLSHDFDDKDTKKNIKTMDSAEKCISLWPIRLQYD